MNKNENELSKTFEEMSIDDEEKMNIKEKKEYEYE